MDFDPSKYLTNTYQVFQEVCEVDFKNKKELKMEKVWEFIFKLKVMLINLVNANSEVLCRNAFKS